jgi:hypothetical protein
MNAHVFSYEMKNTSGARSSSEQLNPIDGWESIVVKGLPTPPSRPYLRAINRPKWHGTVGLRDGFGLVWSGLNLAETRL